MMKTVMKMPKCMLPDPDEIKEIINRNLKKAAVIIFREQISKYMARQSFMYAMTENIDSLSWRPLGLMPDSSRKRGKRK